MTTSSGYISLEQLTKPTSLPEQDVPVPELGGNVRVRGMSVKARTEFENSFRSKGGKPIRARQLEVRQRLIVATVIQPTGLTVAHVEALGQQNAGAIERIVNVAQELCGMTNDDVEEIAKNSEETTDAS